MLRYVTSGNDNFDRSIAVRGTLIQASSPTPISGFRESRNGRDGSDTDIHNGHGLCIWRLLCGIPAHHGNGGTKAQTARDASRVHTICVPALQTRDPNESAPSIGPCHSPGLRMIRVHLPDRLGPTLACHPEDLGGA